MDGPHTMPRQIQQALGRGWTVLTANQRAARTLHHGFDLDQRALGRTHWEPPAVLAWEAWLASLWHRLLLDGIASELLLNPTQEHTLWRAIIAADGAADGAASSLRPIDALAELAAGAWHLLHAYCGRRRLQAAVTSADTRAFARWASEFERRSARSQFLTQAQLPEALRAAFAEESVTATLPTPAGLLLVGFDSKTPAQTALLDAIRATGTQVEEFEQTSPAHTLTLVAAPDERAELTACAHWLRARLTQQPDARIAVIVPAIETARAEIDRVFRQTLAPELNAIDAPANSGPFEFSLGVPLPQTPMVSTALDILRWATDPLPLDRVSALLLSPHFAAHSSESAATTSVASSEHLARAEFDAFVLRRRPLLQPEISLDALHTLVAASKHLSNLTVLLKHLSALRPLFLRRDLLTAERTHADWAATFHELLDGAGWAAPGRDSSAEFQTRRKWESALDELTTLDFDSRSDGTRVRFATALAALNRIAAQTLFAPESRHAPVQIMGPLESAGSSFDAVWFLGANDLAWPAKPTPNPLLPWLLQRELSMPGADPAHDTAHALRITERIAACAPTVFSYAQQSAEGQQRPSPIFTGLAASGVARELRSADQIAPAEPAAEPVELEAFADDAPIPPPPDRVLQGGASILAAQAACGFRAFAEKRLFSSALDPASLGLDPRERGSLVHTVLERFWVQVGTQAALKRMTLDERSALLNRSIDDAFAKDHAHPAPGWPRAYLNTERQRLLNLLSPWLDYEANQRPPFTVQSREETLHDVQIGPLHLDIRVDRIDRIDLTQFSGESDDESGEEEEEGQLTGEIILDYKTGPASPVDWLGDRPDAPQLPLYAIVSDAPHLAAVAFASVRPGKDLGLHGYESQDGVLPRAAKLKAASLEAQVSEWREVLSALAEDFHSGHAYVDPKQYPKTCAHCEQRLLCRLDPATLDANSLDEDSGADSQAGPPIPQARRPPVAELLRFPPKSPGESKPAAPPDADARRQALDIRRSFIVEAPAGSGKTGLLIQRLLKLLADESVEQPEQVLAITFTNKATAEMRDRVLAHLTAAAQSAGAEQSTDESAVLDQLAAVASEPAPAENGFQAETRELARAVMTHDRQLGWALLDHPQRLNIRTIDSVCAEISRTLPVLSGSGGRLTPATDAEPLHREAARRTLLLLGTGDAAFDTALRNLLLHRDGNLAECESLLTNMLSMRDQWGDLIPLAGPQLDEVWLDANVLPRLELALDHAIRAALMPLAQAFPAGLLAELTALAADLGHAAPYDPEAPSPIAICANLHTPPAPLASHLDHWLALLHLLTIGNGSWRKDKGLTGRNLKFAYNRKHSNHTRLVNLLDALRNRDDLLLAFEKVRDLPPAHYPADQWAVAKSLFRVLGRALVELQLVFAARNQCDFTELSLLARQALRSDSGADDLAAALGARLQHLLVDEMQDTSTGQYQLIELLTANWDAHSQTVFLVGDPRQSIYLFRQARVERFIQAMHSERLGDLPLTRLRLTANFRSQSRLVDDFNQNFALIFPSESVLPYTHAHSTLPASPNVRGTVWHANPISISPDDATTVVLTPAQHKQQQSRCDALEIRRIARQWLSKPPPPGRTEPWQIAVLVRSRNHLNEIVAALNLLHDEDGHAGKIPFRAIEIESLVQRQEVLDLTALTRALLHPADRTAALAVLRAPSCGLSLADLHTLTGCDDPSLQSHSIARLMDERGHLLPDDSCQRLARVWNVLRSAASQRARLTPAQLVERAWRSLGGDAWLAQSERINANRFFQLLNELQVELEENRSANLLDPTFLQSRLQELYAEPNPIPAGTPFVELLTIHKAKGLEWDVVLVPALERQPATDRSRLLTWSELEPPDSSGDTAAHLMLAPIAGRGEPSKALNNWLNGIHRAREAAERKRLFYVACTRARQELHLFAAPSVSTNGEIHPHSTSLLMAAWPAAEPRFTAATSTSSRPEAAHFAAVVEGPPHFSPHTTESDPFVLDLAASAAPSHSTLQRLPLAFEPTSRFTAARAHKLPYGDPDNNAASSQAPSSRPEGSFAARSFGNVVHAALETIAARIATGSSSDALLAELPAWTSHIAAMLRADGLPHAIVNRYARDAHAAMESTLRDRDGLWLLAPHTAASNEFALTAWPQTQGPDGQIAIRPTSIRIDRIFRAGAEPHVPGEDVLWIVDYKTTAPHSSAGLDDFLAAHRATYAPQLETYARILTQLPHPPDRPAPKEVRLALYYPTLPRLLWWPLANPPA